MSYKTELMEQILKSPQAYRISQMISPVYGEAYTFLWLIQAIGIVLDETGEWSSQIATEVTPATATWSIGFWEAEYGIEPEPWWTLEQRRKNIMNFMHYVLPMPPARLSEIVSNAASVPVDIIENTGKNKFDVAVRFQTGGFERIQRELNKYKPAHLIYDMYVWELAETAPITVFAGIAASTRKNYTVEINKPDDRYVSERVETELTTAFAGMVACTRRNYRVEVNGFGYME